jgi:hypothetical protein
MKTFGELTLAQKELAVERAKDLLISYVVEGVIEIAMPDKAVQREFEHILTDMRKNENMAKAKELITQHKVINNEFDKISIRAAETTQYDLSGNNFIMKNH